MSDARPPARRRLRIGLYAPFAVLLLIVVGWSVAWYVVRERTRSGLDEWIASEAASGRRWSCADRAIGGYPFRIEVACSSLSVDRPDVRASLGRLLVVSQVYNPRHVIAEVSGPMRVTAGELRADATWNLMQASVLTTDGGFERLSLTVDGPSVQMEGGPVGRLSLGSRRFEAHLRPEPGRDAAYDLALRSEGALIPGLDDLVGGTEPADIAVSLDVTQTSDLPARPLWSELERWRAAGGKVDLTRIAVTKGPRRLEAKGLIGIDEQHRPEGQLDLSAANAGGLLGRLSSGAGGLLGALLGGGGGGAAPVANDGAGAPLKPLPQLRVKGGRLYLGPLAIPGVRLPALY